ncbi:MAG: THUMP domain-containing protein [Acidimicrobiia bacterium]|nr:THUMP domain-containing protein [Acidimicrobiia bacterium]
MSSSPNPPQYLRAVASSEIFIKSRRTRARFMPILQANLEHALGGEQSTATVTQGKHNDFQIVTDDLEAAGATAARVFGIDRLDLLTHIEAPTLEALASGVDRLVGDEVVGKKFAVRVRRTGNHEWRSKDAEIAIGNALIGRSAGVDLTAPELLIRVRVERQSAGVVAKSWSGPSGLPVGTQSPALVLLSGGIDSPVAAWMMMRRGCPIDMLHFQLECNQADHALAVGHGLATAWGYGADTTFHVINFESVKKEISASVHPRLRQVILKQLMTAAAHQVAGHLDIPLVVTGDSLGQVSSQTAANLVEIDRYAGAPVLRPLLTFTKQEIVDRARQIGTYELSTRAREVCDLSEGRPVETAAPTDRLLHSIGRLRSGLIDDAMATWESIPAAEWFPGVPLTPRGA